MFKSKPKIKNGGDFRMKHPARISVVSVLAFVLMLLTCGAASAQTSVREVSEIGSSPLAPSLLAPSPRAPNPHVPMSAYALFDYLLSHNYTPPKNYGGGSVYNNSNNKLPKPPAGWRWFEYNVNPGSGTAERIVTIRNGKGVEGGYPYYTPNHYTTFYSMYIK
jgi:guanyl-specific ribonuclease Sa